MSDYIPVGMSYTATVDGSTEKCVTCEGCGYVYGYIMWRTGSGHAISPLFLFRRDAQNAARADSQEALRAALEGCDAVPCPACGRYQADMLPLVRAAYRPGLRAAGLVAFAVGAIVWFGLTVIYVDYSPWPVLVGAVAAFGGFTGVRWWLAWRFDPNDPADVNGRKSEGRFRARRVCPAPQAGTSPSQHDRHVTLTVQANQVRRGEAVDVSLPGGAGVVVVRLRPDMAGRKVRLAGALADGAGDLYVQILVDEIRTDTPDHQDADELLTQLRGLAGGDERLVQQALDAERIRHPDVGFAELLRRTVDEWTAAANDRPEG